MGTKHTQALNFPFNIDVKVSSICRYRLSAVLLNIEKIVNAVPKDGSTGCKYILVDPNNNAQCCANQRTKTLARFQASPSPQLPAQTPIQSPPKSSTLSPYASPRTDNQFPNSTIYYFPANDDVSPSPMSQNKQQTDKPQLLNDKDNDDDDDDDDDDIQSPTQNQLKENSPQQQATNQSPQNKQDNQQQILNDKTPTDQSPSQIKQEETSPQQYIEVLSPQINKDDEKSLAPVDKTPIDLSPSQNQALENSPQMQSTISSPQLDNQDSQSQLFKDQLPIEEFPQQKQTLEISPQQLSESPSQYQENLKSQSPNDNAPIDQEEADKQANENGPQQTPEIVPQNPPVDQTPQEENSPLEQRTPIPSENTQIPTPDSSNLGESPNLKQDIPNTYILPRNDEKENQNNGNSIIGAPIPGSYGLYLSPQDFGPLHESQNTAKEINKTANEIHEIAGKVNKTAGQIEQKAQHLYDVSNNLRPLTKQQLIQSPPLYIGASQEFYSPRQQDQGQQKDEDIKVKPKTDEIPQQASPLIQIPESNVAQPTYAYPQDQKLFQDSSTLAPDQYIPQADVLPPAYALPPPAYTIPPQQEQPISNNPSNESQNSEERSQFSPPPVVQVTSPISVSPLIANFEVSPISSPIYTPPDWESQNTGNYQSPLQNVDSPPQALPNPSYILVSPPKAVASTPEDATSPNQVISSNKISNLDREQKPTDIYQAPQEESSSPYVLNNSPYTQPQVYFLPTSKPSEQDPPPQQSDENTPPSVYFSPPPIVYNYQESEQKQEIPQYKAQVTPPQIYIAPDQGSPVEGDQMQVSSPIQQNYLNQGPETGPIFQSPPPSTIPSQLILPRGPENQKPDPQYQQDEASPKQLDNTEIDNAPTSASPKLESPQAESKPQEPEESKNPFSQEYLSPFIEEIYKNNQQGNLPNYNPQNQVPAPPPATTQFPYQILAPVYSSIPIKGPLRIYQPNEQPLPKPPFYPAQLINSPPQLYQDFNARTESPNTQDDQNPFKGPEQSLSPQQTQSPQENQSPLQNKDQEIISPYSNQQKLPEYSQILQPPAIYDSLPSPPQYNQSPTQFQDLIIASPPKQKTPQVFAEPLYVPKEFTVSPPPTVYYSPPQITPPNLEQNSDSPEINKFNPGNISNENNDIVNSPYNTQGYQTPPPTVYYSSPKSKSSISPQKFGIPIIDSPPETKKNEQPYNSQIYAVPPPLVFNGIYDTKDNQNYIQYPNSELKKETDSPKIYSAPLPIESPPEVLSKPENQNIYQPPNQVSFPKSPPISTSIPVSIKPKDQQNEASLSPQEHPVTQFAFPNEVPQTYFEESGGRGQNQGSNPAIPYNSVPQKQQEPKQNLKPQKPQIKLPPEVRFSGNNKLDKKGEKCQCTEKEKKQESQVAVNVVDSQFQYQRISGQDPSPVLQYEVIVESNRKLQNLNKTGIIILALEKNDPQNGQEGQKSGQSFGQIVSITPDQCAKTYSIKSEIEFDIESINKDVQIQTVLLPKSHQTVCGDYLGYNEVVTTVSLKPLLTIQILNVTFDSWNKPVVNNNKVKAIYSFNPVIQEDIDQSLFTLSGPIKYTTVNAEKIKLDSDNGKFNNYLVTMEVDRSYKGPIVFSMHPRFRYKNLFYSYGQVNTMPSAEVFIA